VKRILFVDDEAALLDGLRGRLRCLRSRWHMVFVESGARALTEMEEQGADVVVADMRMPGMDGAELLTHVRDRWPETIRIVLSGYAEEEQSARLLTVAHQYLSKPCEAQQLENVIGRCIELHQLLSEPGLRAVVGRLKNLPAMPRTYTKLRDAMAKPDASVPDVARIIYEDPAIAAKVLQVVNSAFFRLARRISNIEQAVSYLGFNAIRTLAMSVEVFSLWRAGAVVQGLEPEALQERAHRVAAGARALSEGTAMRDDALLAGLFHNIGHWVLLQECPQQLQLAIDTARSQNLPLHEAERQVIGASHAEIGAYLLGLWGLPYAVIEAVAFQHWPQRVGQAQYDVLAALVTAAWLINEGKALAPGVCERPDVSINDEYLQRLQAPFGWTEAQQRITRIASELQP
jgi:HD-like signal output (HDOD) protein/ActR/RegA family two-component response regulator